MTKKNDFSAIYTGRTAAETIRQAAGQAPEPTKKDGRGRPAKGRQLARVNTYLTPENLHFLDVMAFYAGTTRTDAINAILTQYRTEHGAFLADLMAADAQNRAKLAAADVLPIDTEADRIRAERAAAPSLARLSERAAEAERMTDGARAEALAFRPATRKAATKKGGKA